MKYDVNVTNEMDWNGSNKTHNPQSPDRAVCHKNLDFFLAHSDNNRQIKVSNLGKRFWLDFLRLSLIYGVYNRGLQGEENKGEDFLPSMSIPSYFHSQLQEY